ncbi:MAG TPA: hypothetical protein VGQ99_05190, partial [Tepidisphaeraceae bacterium]|nr:hypothetical protein [Tepidisphaeraceae bacterium]
ILAASPVLAGGSDPTGLIVHEWGTFTSFAGSDGISLEFRPLTTSDLPGFVYDRAKQANLFNARFSAGDRSIYTTKATTSSRQRMETPVTYFYSDKERVVDVTVGFPKGLLTEFYPPVRMMMPVFVKNQPERLENSVLTWEKVKIIPQANLKSTMTPPAVSGADHYGYARETDSAMLQLDDKLLSKSYYEKFLFYRGVGNFDLPVTLESKPDGKFVIRNDGKEAIHAAFLVQIRDGHIRFAKLGQIGKELEAALPQEEMRIEELADQVAAAIVGEGMYEKEARAMVNTWRSSWFGEEGTRLLYLLPGTLTDKMIPLKVTPAADQVVRVMVGRLEVLTPQVEKSVENLLIQLASPMPKERDDAMAGIIKFGRFAEPALQRVAKISDDPEVKARAKELLIKLQK